MKDMNNISQISIGDLYKGVTDGKIISDIELQREIVYDADRQALVIDSILCGIPLPAFYLWRNTDGILEVLDGKQRIEAIKNFRQNDLPYNGILWKKLPPETQEKFNNTNLSVIICQGDETLKREIFRRINTLGISLSQFEVLNGLYHGTYLVELSDCANLASVKHIFGNNSRGKNQIHLLQWLLLLYKLKPTREAINDFVKEKKDCSFEEDFNRLRPHINFVREVFTDYSFHEIYFRLSLIYLKDKGIWKNHMNDINQAIKDFKKSEAYKLIPDKYTEIENRIRAIIGHISVDPKRLFTPDDKAKLLATMVPKDGKYQCYQCHQYLYPNELTVDHVHAWSLGGRTELSNAKLVCRACNSRKGNSE